MGKSKEVTGDVLLKKERLRAKELTLSEEYREDISRHAVLAEELSNWRIEERALLRLPHPIIASPEVLNHIHRGYTIRSEVSSSYDNILKKYSISRPVSLELLKRIADGEVKQLGLRHRDEIPVKMLLPDGMCRGIEHDGYQVDLDSKECFSIEINPRGSKTDILHYVSKLLDACAAHGIKENKRVRDKMGALEDGEKIYTEVQAGKTLLQIAKERCGINKNPAYDPTVKAEHEKVRRYYQEVKRLKEG